MAVQKLVALQFQPGNRQLEEVPADQASVKIYHNYGTWDLKGPQMPLDPEEAYKIGSARQIESETRYGVVGVFDANNPSHLQKMEETKRAIRFL
jgi:hypothetical protein